MEKFNGIIEEKIEIIIKETQGIISFGYITLIGLGMIFESIYYGQFGINIFNYSGILDFLLVPFRRPIVLGILIGVYLFIHIYFFTLNKFLRNKLPKVHKSIYGRRLKKDNYLKSNILKLLMLYLIITVSWAYIISKKNKKSLYNKEINTRIEYDTKGEKYIEGKLIGKNEINIFLLDIHNEIQILPINSDIIKIIP